MGTPLPARAADHRGAGLRLSFGLVVFLSAFLLFQVQLIAGKYILPWFGGSAAVWTTCLLLFQLLLLLGYGYAHAGGRLGGSGRRRLHLGLLLLSVALLVLLGFRWSSPITPSLGGLSPEQGNPILEILLVLTTSVGLPFFLLSTTSPLLQDLYAQAQAGGSVYRLYALSNAGSLLGLVTYPFLVEPWITLHQQAWLWCAAYLLFAAGAAGCVLAAGRRAAAGAPAEASKPKAGPPDPAPSLLQRLLWLLLAACGTTLLLATTNYLSQDLAVVPLIWVLPLSLYLLSFVLTFQSERLYRRWWAYPALAVATALACYAIFRSGFLPVRAEIWIFSLAQLAGCLVCHGEVHRLKPAPRHLTSFYLALAAGGALGTAFVSLLAPVLFQAVWEFHLALGLCALLAAAMLLLDPAGWLRRASSWQAPVATLGVGLLPMYVALNWGLEMPKNLRLYFWIAMGACALPAVAALAWRRKKAAPLRGARFSVLIAPLMLSLFLVMDTRSYHGTLVLRERNFYGVLSVLEQGRGDPMHDSYELYHGRVLHGLQLRNPALRHRATSYYGNQSGIGLALRYQARRWNPVLEQATLRVGVLGLGTGTVLIYGVPGDYFRVYELNPAIVRLSQGADPYFSYVRDCRGQADIVLGDARLSLQAEADRGQLQQFDVLVLDAFNGDAIPVHLLTREAFALYLKHLRDDRSIIAINITNHVLDLSGVVSGLAREYGFHGLRIRTRGQGGYLQETDWILLSRHSPVLKAPAVESEVEDLDLQAPGRVWTDDYSNIFSLLK